MSKKSVKLYIVLENIREDSCSIITLTDVWNYVEYEVINKVYKKYRSGYRVRKISTQPLKLWWVYFYDLNDMCFVELQVPFLSPYDKTRMEQELLSRTHPNIKVLKIGKTKSGCFTGTV